VGSKPNVHIRFQDVVRVFGQDLPPRLIDFLEIAAYAFTADCATFRGDKWTKDDSIEPWGRDLAFVVAVRDVVFWNKIEVRNLLEDVLDFLSNDKYSFTFVPLHRDRDSQPYFKFGDQTEWPFNSPERVIMFSGGLDSLAGAVETAMKGEKLVLVSHRSVSTMDARQRSLFTELQKKFADRLIRVPVWVNKSKSAKESTQRTRSFLFAALGTVVAQSVQAGGVRFFENGIVSLNLPLAQEAVRARASRTTHPVTLYLLSSLCAAVTGREFVVDNPYLFKTKTEVVASLATHDAAQFISYSCSCSHSMFKGSRRHCGLCSQCIDRRFAVTAAGLLDYENAADYVSDVFVGRREKDVDRAIAVDYTRHGIELNLRSEEQLAERFNAEIGRAVRYEAKRSEAAHKIIAMQKRHGETVTRVLEQAVREHASRLSDGTLDSTSLLALAIGSRPEERQLRGSTESASGSQHIPPDSENRLLPVVTRMEGKLDAVLAKFEPGSPRRAAKKKSLPSKRDTIIFAALVRELRAENYCTYLHNHNVTPKWDHPTVTSYTKGYELGDPWRKKIQDEKTRAKTRMNGYPFRDLLQFFINSLPQEFDGLSRLLNSRNSCGASKTLESRKPHKP
jgi:7-cyano-7-deazaguanine synthase in queuosine biosynthesis